MDTKDKTEEVEKKENENSNSDASDEKNNTDTKEGDTSKKDEGGDGSDDKEVTLTKEEYEKLQNKARDYEGMIRKKRLEKLNKKEEKTEEKKEDNSQSSEEKVAELVDKKVNERISQMNKEKYDSNLTEAYTKFVSDNKWADSDEAISAISQVFNSGGKIEVNDLVGRLNEAARTAFPDKAEEALREKIKAELLAKDRNINAGEAGAGGSSQKTETEEKLAGSREDQQLADRFFNGDLQRYLKYKKKNAT